MQQVHTTTKNPQTYIRILLLLLISAVIVFLVPYVGEEAEEAVTARIFNIGVLFAITVGFIMSLTLSRKSELDARISLELNKIRRIYHLGFHLALINPKLKPWFKELNRLIRKYCNRFKQGGFKNYDQGSPIFREITYNIYGMPKLVKHYNGSIYSNLLSAAGSATEAREHISSKMVSRIGYLLWADSITLSLTLNVLIALATPFNFVSRVVGFIAIFNVFLFIDLLYEYDRINNMRDKFLASLYVNNIKKLPKDPFKNNKSK